MLIESQKMEILGGEEKARMGLIDLLKKIIFFKKKKGKKFQNPHKRTTHEHKQTQRQAGEKKK